MEWVACVGIDWSDQKHDWRAWSADGKGGGGVFSSKPEQIQEWVRQLRERYPEGKILIALEQSRGALIYALSEYDFLLLMPINPRALKAYRESQRLSGAKDDPSDADLICEFGRLHHERLRIMRPDDVMMRKLRLLAESRRSLVNHRTAAIQALTATCKEYFPQLLGWFGGAKTKLTLAFLAKWPTLTQAKAARPATVRAFIKSNGRRTETKIEEVLEAIRSAVALTSDPAIVEAKAITAQSLGVVISVLDEQVKRHDQEIEKLIAADPDCELFASFPGAGPVMAPRLAVAFGRDRTRWDDATQIQSYSGIAPVVESSGKERWVHARWRCPKFLRQTFHEFAEESMPHSSWALAFYRQQRDRGAGHHAAIRSLAYRWIRILFRCWKLNEHYDEARYIARLRQTNSPVVKRLAA
jgi:Transposase IS116/IS110/IS902 family./Transposase.